MVCLKGLLLPYQGNWRSVIKDEREEKVMAGVLQDERAEEFPGEGERARRSLMQSKRRRRSGSEEDALVKGWRNSESIIVRKGMAKMIRQFLP